MAVLNATEIMGQDIVPLLCERVIILGCVVAIHSSGQNRPRTKDHAAVCCSMGRCVPRQQVNPTHIGFGVSENAGGGSLGFWVNLFKASLSGLNRKSFSIISDGATGYSPEKQASQY